MDGCSVGTSVPWVAEVPTETADIGFLRAPRELSCPWQILVVLQEMVWPWIARLVGSGLVWFLTGCVPHP